jgi:multiple antibiotic resistance protein
MNITSVLSVTIILFSVIDIIGSLPIIINMKKEGVAIEASTATIVSAMIMISFLFFGASILGVFGIEISSFAIAGSLVMFFIGLEMILGIRFFREDSMENKSGSIVPIAFPLLAGAGTLTTIISLKVQFDTISIIIGIVINLLIIYTLLRSTDWLSRKMTAQMSSTLRKVFGIILLAIAIQIVKNNLI